MRIVINGVGIAGPTLAFWLRKAGHEVLLIEAAPRLRSGGYVIDFGLVGYDVAEKMGLIPRIKELGYQMKEARFVDPLGHKCSAIPVHVVDRLTRGRYTSLRRSDLASTIYHAVEASVETIFGDSVAGIEEQGHGLRVRFDNAPPRDADLVIGADGLHSRVRGLTFGPDAGAEVPLGYHVAAFEVEGYRPRDELVYVSHAVPGRQVSRFSMREDRTVFLLVFRDEYLNGRSPSNERDPKSLLARVFADVGWECPRILEAMADAADFYFDRISQVRLDRWAKGRTALVGDAAACISLLGGEGAGLAMAEAYVLAGELHTCGGDHAKAFARYQERMMPFLKRKQAMAASFASSFAPRTAFGITFRNLVLRMMRLPFVVDFVFGRALRNNVELPDYGF